MQPEQMNERAAQRTDEELKKHGDQLKKQVEAASADPRETDTRQKDEAKEQKDRA